VRRITLPLSRQVAAGLRAGDWLLLNGKVLTGRDQTHRVLVDLLRAGKSPPVDLKDQLIYYVGPSPAPPGMAIGSAGPTTSYRMDAYTPELLAQGVVALMGKGRRSDEVRQAIARHGAVYLATIGGAGAFLSRAVESARVVAFEELGPEAMYELELKDFPAVVINDSEGGDYYRQILP
jgi:fumarate hydratase subunit beta